MQFNTFLKFILSTYILSRALNSLIRTSYWLIQPSSFVLELFYQCPADCKKLCGLYAKYLFKVLLCAKLKMKYLLMMCIDRLIEPVPAVTVSHLATVSAPLLSVRHQTLSFPLPPAAADALSPENILAAKTFTLDKKAGRCQQNPNLYRRSPPSLGARQAVRPGRAERQIQQTNHRSTL